MAILQQAAAPHWDPTSMIFLVTSMLSKQDTSYWNLLMTLLIHILLQNWLKVVVAFSELMKPSVVPSNYTTVEIDCGFTDNQSASYDRGSFISLLMTPSAKAVFWMLFNDPKALANAHTSKLVYSEVWQVQLNPKASGTDPFSRQMALPFDVNQSYTLSCGMIVSVCWTTTEETLEYKDNHSVSSNQSHSKKSVSHYKCTLKLMSSTMTLLEMQAWITEKVAEYTDWVKSMQEPRMILFSEGSKDSWLSFKKRSFTSTKSFSNLFFEGKDDLIKRIDKYTNLTEEYKRLGIPHTLGLLFHGEPGCGKTSVIKALANYMNRSLVCINMSHVNSVECLRDVFCENNYTSSIPVCKKRIYVFEEIDCSMDNVTNNPFLSRELLAKIKRENELKAEQMQALTASMMNKFLLPPSVDLESIECDDDAVLPSKESSAATSAGSPKPKGKITLGEMLELLDGLAESDDRIIIFTTNYPDRLDKAFMRPGRIDISIEFKKLRKVDMDDLFNLWFHRRIPAAVMDKLQDHSMSQADFGKLCFQYQEDPDAMIEHLGSLA